MPTNTHQSIQPSPAKPPRIFTRTDQHEICPEALNRLFAKAGLPERNLEKLTTALQHSLLCVTAWSSQNQDIVGFVRASGDGVFNAAIWDLVVDPTLPNQDAAKILLIDRLKLELRRKGLQGAISIFAQAQDLELLGRAKFVEDQKGIRAMALGTGLV